MADLRMIEIREKIYRQVLLGRCFVEIGELKTDQSLKLNSDSGDESDYSDSFVEAECDMGGTSEDIEDILAKETESNEGGSVLMPVITPRHHKEAIKSGVALAILRTCHQVYAEASTLFHSMLEVVITPEQVVDLHIEEEVIQRSANMKPMPLWLPFHLGQVYKEGIFEILGWGFSLGFCSME